MDKRFAFLIVLLFSACADDDSLMVEPDASVPPDAAIDASMDGAVAPPATGPVVFLVAGQSNAEGNVFTAGLEGLAGALPEGEEALDATQTRAARVAVGQAIGGFCSVPPGCIDDPEECREFSYEYADAVIEGLRASSVPWRMMNRDYVHPTASLLVANFNYAPVQLVDGSGAAIDNESCSADPMSSTREGPFLQRYTPSLRQSLGPGFGSRSDPEEGPTYGPELAFGEVMSRTLPETYIVKVTMGGSSLQDHWRIDGPLYMSLLANAREELSATGGRLGGLVWFQGFNDQFEGVYCEDLAPLYEANLRAFLQALRTELESPELPIVIVGPRTEGRLPEIAMAQQAVAAGDENITIVSSSGLSHCFHYGSGSMLLIGERAGLAMQELLAE
jgi:hypothetical protein